jgi:hypothetical protein
MGTVQMNTWLTIWAVIGPLLTGGVGAWWNWYRNNIDRNYRAETDQKLREEIRNETKAAATLEDKRRQLDWRRKIFIDFLSASQDFVWKGAGTQETDVRERHRERFSKCFATLMLLDQAQIGFEAVAVWNACYATVAEMEGTNQQAQDAASAALRDARQAFAEKGQQLLLDQIRGADIAREVVATAI